MGMLQLVWAAALLGKRDKGQATGNGAQEGMRAYPGSREVGQQRSVVESSAARQGSKGRLRELHGRLRLSWESAQLLFFKGWASGCRPQGRRHFTEESAGWAQVQSRRNMNGQHWKTASGVRLSLCPCWETKRLKPALAFVERPPKEQEQARWGKMPRCTTPLHWPGQRGCWRKQSPNWLYLGHVPDTPCSIIFPPEYAKPRKAELSRSCTIQGNKPGAGSGCPPRTHLAPSSKCSACPGQTCTAARQQLLCSSQTHWVCPQHALLWDGSG